MEILTWINHPMQGKGIYDGIEKSLPKWKGKFDSLKGELQDIVSLGIPILWRMDKAHVLDVEFLSKIQEVAIDSLDIDNLIASFNEISILQFFDYYRIIKVKLQ